MYSSDCKRNEEEAQAVFLFPAVRPGGHPEKYQPSCPGACARAALLRTYLFSGSVALLDEPFSALDMLTKKSVHDQYLVMDPIHLSTLFAAFSVYVS